MSLFPFQQAAVTEILEDLARGIRAVRLAAPTGSGKTRMLAAVVAATRSPPTAWIWTAPLDVLLAQTQEPLSAAGLRVRDLASDRSRPYAPGDAWLATLQLLANDEATLHADSEHGPSLLRWRQALRQDGLRLGIVIDEAHVGLDLDRKATAFAQRLQALAPDLLLAASATPNDARLLSVVRALRMPSTGQTVARRDAVAAGLVKPRLVFAHLSPLRDALLGEEARRQILLRHALEQLDAQAADARAHQIPLRPLLLLQVANDDGANAEAEGEALIRRTFGWTLPGAVARADGKSRSLRDALSRPDLRALVFKEAGALGFDAPEAAALVSFRTVLGQDRAQQAIGRILRIPEALRRRLQDPLHPLPDDVRTRLTTAWICIPDRDIQAGYSDAARALHALEQDLDAPVEIQEIPFADPASPTVLLPRLKGSYPDWDALAADAAQMGIRFHRRRLATPETPTDPPACLPSEQAADAPLLQTLEDAVLWEILAPTPADLQALLPQARGEIQIQLVREAMALDRPDDSSEDLSFFLEITDETLLALEAHRFLRRRFRHLEHGLVNRLRDRLRQDQAVQALGLSPQGFQILFAALMARRADALAARIADLRDARARQTLVTLPDLLLSPADLPLPRLRRALYGISMPPPKALDRWRAPALPETLVVGGLRHLLAPMDETFALNQPEQELVRLLEDPSLDGEICWWHRNPPRKPWSVGLRRSDAGGLHYPDFLVGLAGGGRRLVETKADTEEIAALKRREPLKSYGPEILLHAGPDGLRQTAFDGQPTGPRLTPRRLLGLLQV